MSTATPTTWLNYRPTEFLYDSKYAPFAKENYPTKSDWNKLNFSATTNPVVEVSVGLHSFDMTTVSEACADLDLPLCKLFEDLDG